MSRSILLTITIPLWLLAFFALLLVITNPANFWGIVIFGFLFSIPVGIPGVIVASILGLVLYFSLNALRNENISRRNRHIFAFILGFIAFTGLWAVGYLWVEVMFLIIDDFTTSFAPNYAVLWTSALSNGCLGAWVGIHLTEEHLDTALFLKGLMILSVLLAGICYVALGVIATIS